MLPCYSDCCGDVTALCILFSSAWQLSRLLDPAQNHTGIVQYPCGGCLLYASCRAVAVSGLFSQVPSEGCRSRAAGPHPRCYPRAVPLALRGAGPRDSHRVDLQGPGAGLGLGYRAAPQNPRSLPRTSCPFGGSHRGLCRNARGAAAVVCGRQTFARLCHWFPCVQLFHCRKTLLRSCGRWV